MTGSLGSRRHTASRPCPICGGHARLAQGRGIRCAGFTLDTVSYCTRPEFADNIPLDTHLSPPGYEHSLRGTCPCGVAHIGAPPPPSTEVGSPDGVARPPALSIDERDRVYQEAISALPLRRPALDDLERRGLTRADIDSFGFRSLPQRGAEHAEFLARMRDRFGGELLRLCPGFVDKNGRLTFWSAYAGRDGYVVPYADERGRVTGLQAKLIGGRYLTAAGARYEDMYVVAGTPAETLFVVEGGTKAMVASVVGPAWCFGVPGQALQDRHIDVIRNLQPARVAVALDREHNVVTDAARQKWVARLAVAVPVVCDAVWERA